MISCLRTFALILALTCGLLAAQESPALHISGTGMKSLDITAQEFAKMPRITVTVPGEHGGKPQRYEGVRVSDLLEKAGAPIGTMHGAELRSYVVATASDNYKVLYSVAELDPAMNGNRAIVADKLNGKPLPPKTGPFQVIIPTDRHGSRSIHMLRSLEVVTIGELK